MFVDDDSKENNVSSTTATMVLESQLADSSESAPRELDGLGALFREHYQGIFRVAYRITGSQSDAEDVLQTIFVRLTPGWSGRDLSPNPRAFLYRAAINASLDVVRRRTRVNS